MVIEFIYMMLGPWSRVALPWLASQSSWIAGLGVVLVVLVGAGEMQLKKNEQYLQKDIVAVAHSLRNQGRDILPEDVFEKVQKDWSEQINKLAWFIPHRWDMWPIPATLPNVKERIGFSPEWVKNVLVQNKFLAK